MSLSTVSQAAFLKALEEGAEYLGVVGYGDKVYVHARVWVLEATAGEERWRVIRAEVQS